MLIETRHKMRRVKGAKVFKETPSSLLPKPQKNFFGNQGSMPLIHLGESNWISWFPKDLVVTLLSVFTDFSNQFYFQDCQIFPKNKKFSNSGKIAWALVHREGPIDREGLFSKALHNLQEPYKYYFDSRQSRLCRTRKNYVLGLV